VYELATGRASSHQQPIGCEVLSATRPVPSNLPEVRHTSKQPFLCRNFSIGVYGGHADAAKTDNDGKGQSQNQPGGTATFVPQGKSNVVLQKFLETNPFVKRLSQLRNIKSG